MGKVDPCKGGGIRADVKHPKYYTLAESYPMGAGKQNEARHAATLICIAH